MNQPQTKSMDEIVALCKRRGFVFPASDIYGGINGFWDYGPLGTLLKNNLRDAWWKAMVTCPPLAPDGEPVQIVGLDSAIIQNPNTWVASGHVAGFNDPMVDCRKTKMRYRADQVVVLIPSDEKSLWYAYPEGDPDHIARKLKKAHLDRATCEAKNLTQIDLADYPKIVGPDADEPGTLTEPRQFNLMFESYAGAIKDEHSKVYLRPETAQGIFLNYKNVVDTSRVKVPFGVAQSGKAFRNEVTPRNFIFRSREFEQMELEWFCHPDESIEWFNYWKQQRLEWWKSLGIDSANLRMRDHEADELAHYSKACVDIEYRYPFTSPGFGELEGIAHRGAFDLTQHQEHSKIKLEYFDQDRNERYLPNVIEPSSGLTRGVLVLLCEAYTVDDSRPSKMYMKFEPSMAPIKAAIFPLVNKDGLPEVAQKLYMELRRKHVCQIDAKQNIGKRYARMDEAGTPFCFTVDSQTLEDQTVTVRDRDTQSQERIGLDRVGAFLEEKIGGA